VVEHSSDRPFDIGALSDRGSVRSKNEDYYGIFDPETDELMVKRGMLVVVTDGMGGHLSGGEASRLVVEVMGRLYYADSEDTAVSALDKAFRNANRSVFEQVGNGRKGTAGTTCTSLALFEDHYHIAHAGDSRAYLVRGGKMEQLTRDHSVVGEMVQKGLIDKDEAARHPRRNVLTRAVGLRGEVEPDIHESLSFEKGDRILVCTDGLYSMVDESEIAALSADGGTDQICEKLVEEAKKNGGEDNVTVVIIEKK